MTPPLLLPLVSALALAAVGPPRFTWDFTPIPEGQTCTVEERAVDGDELRARYTFTSMGLVHAQRPVSDDPSAVDTRQFSYDDAVP